MFKLCCTTWRMRVINAASAAAAAAALHAQFICAFYDNVQYMHMQCVCLCVLYRSV